MDTVKRIGRLFVVKTRWEAWLIVYAIAVGAVTRGNLYMARYPGWMGWMLFAACASLPMVAGPALLDAFPKRRRNPARGDRRAALLRAPADAGAQKRR